MGVQEGIRSTTKPPFGARASAAMAGSSSNRSRTGVVIASTPKDAAAALKGFRKYSKYGAVTGLNRTATRATRGAILEQLQPLAGHRRLQVGETGDVAARPRKARDEA